MEVRDAEVCQLQCQQAVRLEDVARLEIPMDDAARMRMGQGVEDLAKHLTQHRPANRPGRALKRAAGDPLHGEERVARAQPKDTIDGLGHGAVIIDLDDARVGERGGRPDLMREGPKKALMARRVMGQHLDRDGQSLGPMHRLEDHAHATTPDLPKEIEGTKLRRFDRLRQKRAPGAQWWWCPWGPCGWPCSTSSAVASRIESTLTSKFRYTPASGWFGSQSTWSAWIAVM